MNEKEQNVKTPMRPWYKLDGQLIAPRELLHISETKVRKYEPKLRAVIDCCCCSRDESDSDSYLIKRIKAIPDIDTAENRGI